jgi:hypothetical protein
VVEDSGWGLFSVQAVAPGGAVCTENTICTENDPIVRRAP